MILIPPFGRMVCFVIAVGVGLGMVPHPVQAQPEPIKIAISAPLTGSGAITGQAMVNAIRMAMDEASGQIGGTVIDLHIHDDMSTEDGARAAAQAIVDEGAVAVLGPALTTTALAAGPIYAQAGLASIVPTAHGDAITSNATSFRTVFSTSDMGSILARYFHLVLDARHFVVIYKENGYGKPFAEGVRRVATPLGLNVQFLSFSNAEERDSQVRKAIQVADNPAILLGMTADDAVPVLTQLRQNGVRGPIGGTATLARADIIRLFEAVKTGDHTQGAAILEGVYAVSPMIPDSTNSAVLNFIDRYHDRYGQDPSWEALQSYDAFRLLTSALTSSSDSTSNDLSARRAALTTAIAHFDSPKTGAPGLTEPLWFTAEHGRAQSVRMGRFYKGLLQSAPVQMLAVVNPEQTDIQSKTVLPVGNGDYVKLQNVVFTGVFLNEISRMDIAQATFSADFYIWLRYAKAAEAGHGDPAQIVFPEMIRGSFDIDRPDAREIMDDGMVYKLWHVRGDFKGTYDLHRYPVDHQYLSIRLFNARAAADKVVYVRDQGMLEGELTGVQGPNNPRLGASAAEAFRNLTQWEPKRTEQRRDILTTNSALGDQRLVGSQRVRELSGYRIEIELARRTLPTLVKTLLPVAIMGLILFASLWFPNGLLKEKITVAISAALTGSILLSSVNSQLGMVGYTMAVEYFFYIYFSLCLLCIISVLAAERLRAGQHERTVYLVEKFTKLLYGAAMAACLIGGLFFARVV